MARPAFAFALILMALTGAPVFAQSRPERPVQTYSTLPAEDALTPACRTEIDCAPDLAGAPERTRPSKTWSVRSSQVPADADARPVYPIPIIADVEIEDPRRDRDGDHHLDRDDDPRAIPDLRRYN